MGGSLEYLRNHKSVIDQLFGQYWANISQIVCFADDNNKPTPLMVSDHSETYSTDVDNLIEQKLALEKVMSKLKKSIKEEEDRLKIIE